MTRWIILASLMMALFAAPQMAQARDHGRGHGHGFHGNQHWHGYRHGNDHVRINLVAPIGFGYYRPAYVPPPAYVYAPPQCERVSYVAPQRPLLQRQVGWVPVY